MKILVVSQYFWPETFIINDLVKCLTTNGHHVEIVTGKPNYPEGEIFEGYLASGCFTEFFDSIQVHRIPIYPRGKSVKKLLFNYFSFILNGLIYFPRLFKDKNFDVILVYVPSPITSVIPAIYLKWRLKTHLAIWIQDLWPESVKATGFIKNNFLLKIINKLVHWIYASSDTLLIQSEAFRKFVKKYSSEDKIIYYPNSFLETASQPTNDRLPDFLLDELENNHCFIFAGNLGTAQALDILVEAAELLQHLDKFKIILIGSGSKSDWIKQQITEKSLQNIMLAGRFPQSLMPTIFSKAVALLVTLKREEIFSYTIPSKIQAYLAAGRPILAALDGEGARIVEEAKAGLVSSAENASALAQNIEYLYYMPQHERNKLGEAGRAYFIEHFEMQKQSESLIEILDDRIKKINC